MVLQKHHAVNSAQRTLKWLTMVLLAFNGVGALFGGYHLMHDPSGRSIQLPSEYLDGSMFPDYFIPGLALFLCMGVMSIVTLGYSVLQHKAFPILVIIQGILLTGWLLIQILTIREFYYLQVVFGCIALLFIVTGRVLQRHKINLSHPTPPSL